MKNICFTYFPSVKKNILGINRALVAKKNALGINRALVAKKNLASFFVICTALLCGFCGSVKGETLTVANGSETEAHIPIYGLYIDETTTHTQFLYSKGEMIDMVGGTISALTFYSSTASIAWTSS